MNIKKLVIKNFKSLREATINLDRSLNVIVGDNETGKSTLLEAIHLVLREQINGRNIRNEMAPHLFNNDAVKEYLADLRDGRQPSPPDLFIEAYLEDCKQFAWMRGTNNSLRENCPGVALRIEFNEDFTAEYTEYIRDPAQIRTIPIEYYDATWRTFSFDPMASRRMPISTTMIDTSQLSVGDSARRYVLRVVSEVLEPRQRATLQLAYRRMKDAFADDDDVKRINDYLAKKKGDVTDKSLSVSMDDSARSTWESGLATHLDEIPLTLVGRGEQSSVKMKLAMETSADARVLLIEEPENHLSYPNLNNLISKIGIKSAGKQVIVTTHSSFVLNKLGVDSVILFNRGDSTRISDLDPSTRDYFMKLPGHDTLRLVLSKKVILVEGPSDELIVQKAFRNMHGALPLERGVDVISVSMAFKRFLELGVLLNSRVSVVTDNDGDVESVKKKYSDYLPRDDDGRLPHDKIRICFDEDEDHPSLEQQMLRANSRHTLNQALGKQYESDEELLAYMIRNKTDCALSIFNSDIDLRFPVYIKNAIR